MKRINLLFLLLLFSAGLSAQRINKEQTSGVIVASEFHVTRPIREIFAENPVDEDKIIYKEEESEDRKHRIPQKFEFTSKDGPQYGNDPNTIQEKMGTEPNRAPLTNWAGQSATGFRPMDPSGAAGPNHYVQMINSTTFKVYNKSTGANMLTGTFGNLWSPATPNDGDPIVMYDKTADRWFMSQFGSSGNKIYIAISQTPDPTGSYYTYTFSSPLFPDYLKFSVWTDGYYMTSNQSTQRVFSFNRSELLAGNPSARSIYVNFSPPDGGGFFVPLPADAADGSLPPAGTPCPIMSYSDNGWGSGFSDAINIYQMTVNWVPTTPTASITLKANVATASFDASYNASWNDVSQPGTSQKLDGIGGVLMYRAQWKSWSGYNTVVLNWGVWISSTQRSIKWCELRQDQVTTNWSMYQEGIYTPDAATRWMGGIAMDNNGSIGLSYMKSDGTSIYPGIYYTGRKSCDPLGTLPITESVVIAGSGSQTGTNRVGDYAQTVLDPDGITFWHTSEYLGSGGTAKTQIFSYQLPSCGNIASVSIAQTAGSNPMCTGASATFTATPFNGGTTPAYQWKVNGTNVGTNSPTYTTTSLTNGQVVTCVMTSNLAGVTGNPATSNSITMTVNALPAAAGAISGSTTVCKGQTGVVYTVAAIANATGYSWTLPSGASITSGANTNSITVTYSASAIAGNISVYGTNPGCNGTSSSLSISVITPIPTSGTQTVTNSSGITINDATTSSPYPSTITFSGLSGLTQDVNVTITGLTHTFPDDIDVILESPTGQRVTLISDCGSSGSLTGVNLIFDDAASSNLPDGTGITTGSYKPTNFSSPDTYASPGPGSFTAPTGASSTALSVFNGISPNGTWKLYIVDDASQDVGTIASWSITLVVPFSASTITGNSSVCTGQNGVSYSIPAVANATGYNWVLPSGASIASGANTNSISVNYSGSAVSGNITVTPFNSCGNGLISNALSVTVNSAGAASVSISATPSGTICPGTNVTFTATPINGGTPSYQWKKNNVNVGTNSASYADNGLNNLDQITCVMTSSTSCVSGSPATSNAITMSVNASVSPLVTIALTSGTNPMCAGAGATFTATPTNGGTTPSYQWKVSNVNAGTNSPTFTTNALTNGQVVSCVMTSNAACVSPATATSGGISMSVNPAVTPSVSIALTTGTNPSCEGTSLTFTATPTNGGASPAYQWKVDGTNAGINNTDFTVSNLTGGQIISCVMTSNANCASPATATSGTITMTINPVVVPAVSIALTSGSNPQCAGAPVTFTATPVNGGATPSYQWKIDGTNAGTDSPTFTSSALTDGQVVTCVLTSDAECASPVTAASTGITMNVNAVVSPSVTISQTAGTNPQCAGESSTFTAIPVDGGSTPSYQWKVDGLNVGTDNDSYTTNSLTDGQVVSCEMTSTATCVTGNPATSNTVTVVVFSIPSLLSFSPLTGNTGTDVVISGSGFNGVTVVDFNGISATFTIDNDNQITAVVPAGTVEGLVGITNSCGTVHSIASFTLTGSVTLNLKLYLEGFYQGGGQMTGVLSPTVCDTIVVSLATELSPYSIQYTQMGTIDIAGEGAFSFPAAAFGNSFFIVVKHRNTLETWSESPVAINSASISYDFTTSGTKAYGSNMIEIDGAFAIRSGDVNQDGTIDEDDLNDIEAQELLFLTGYVPEDLTGDYIVESADYSIVENNLTRVMARP